MADQFTNVRLLRSRERVRTLYLFYKCSTSSEVVALPNDLLIKKHLRESQRQGTDLLGGQIFVATPNGIFSARPR
jgi:hypothetical protein